MLAKRLSLKVLISLIKALQKIALAFFLHLL